MAAAQRVHDAIVRDAIERHGGYVFATDGDGFGAAFATAASAARAAVEAQRKLRADATIGFAVRMGLHTGETVEHDGNYSGSEVNRAARLMALAHGGQILVSDTTEVLLRNRLSLRPLGEHVLRGSARPDLGVPGHRRRSADRIPGASQRRALRGQPAAAAHLARRSRRTGRQGRRARARPAAGHADRRRRGRQDANGAGGRRRAGRGIPRRSVDGRAGGGRRPGVDPRRDRDRARDHAAGRHSADRPRSRPRWPASGCCSSSTTASTC